MNQHISESHLFQHINHTLNDANQEIVTAHLSKCNSCRITVETLTAEHRMIWQSLQGNLGQVNPSPQANFAAIAPKFASRNRPILSPFLSVRNAFASGLLLAILIISVFVFVNALGSQNMFTNSHIGTTFLPVTNGNFEATDTDDGLTWWTLAGTRPQDYEVSRDDGVYFDGKSSALLASDVEEANEFGTLMQWLTPDESVLGRRVRLSAQIKVEDVADWAGLWMRIDGAPYQTLQFYNMQDQPIRGTMDWQRYEVVLDVPPESSEIYFGVLLAGNGRVWIDNVQLEIVSDDVATTGYTSNQELTNAGFEIWKDNPEGWFLAGSHPQDYKIYRDKLAFVSGEASALLASNNDETSGFGTLMQTFPAKAYLGQRIRLSASIKTENIDGWAGMWMRVDTQNNRTLQFDNMQKRSIRGTTDWTQYEVVLDVPKESVNISLGLLLDGQGKAWFDNITLEAVDQNVPSTDTIGLRQQPMNLGFEGIGPDNLPNGWFLSGKIWQGYELQRDDAIFASGEASALLAATEVAPSSSSAILQVFDPLLYLGKRVRLSALIKTEDVTGWAGLWMFAGRSDNEIFQFDNMQNRPITGTTDWTRYEVVLDMPMASEKLGIGVLLEGNGRVWIDNVSFEIVEENTPSTHCQECWEEAKP